ncbi:DUF4271 domain-containing protein [Chitinophaga sp. 30R24]|uniref:DUF4271 domain-containing protein n=1 Tax=Chitinophaga sp. 30R24 TaxID=3248838 RepID=UPI003B914E76
MRNWLLLLFTLGYLPILAQTTDSSAVKVPAIHKPAVVHTAGDTTRPKMHTAPVKRDSNHTAFVRRDSTRGAWVKRDTAHAAFKRDSTRVGFIQPAIPARKDSGNLAADTSRHKADSLAVAAMPKIKPVTDYDLYMKKLLQENMFLKPGRPRFVDINPARPFRNMDWLIYLVAGVVLLLSIIRLSYRKYFSDLFRAFFNPTLSQRQLKDQLSQSPFPNMLLNVFFAIALGVYLYLVLYRQQVFPQAEPWLLIPGLVVLVAVAYSFKYTMLRFCGWLFGNSELADAYVFILYLINKVLGVLLVPFVVIIAFCKPEIARTFLYISLFFIALLVIYRYIRSYSLVKQYLSFSKLHFFLYLCAFEVAPVLILTKVLQNIWLTGNP